MTRVRSFQSIRDLLRVRLSDLSRRRVLQAGATTLAGAVIGREFFRPAAAASAGSDPIPVPGSPNLAPFHIWAPLLVDSSDAQPASITDFNGVAGLAYVSGMVTRTNVVTHQVDRLPFLDADMRFMQGVYRGVDGKPRRGTFGFI